MSQKLQICVQGLLHILELHFHSKKVVLNRISVVWRFFYSISLRARAWWYFYLVSRAAHRLLQDGSLEPKYSKLSELSKPYGGLGISILSTAKGVMSDHQAKKNNVGGEILCEVF